VAESEHVRRLSRELFMAAFTSEAAGVESWVIDRLVSLITERDVAAGETIFAANQASEHVYFMSEGRIRLSREGAPPWTLEGRWVIGTLDATLERPNARSAVALSDLRLVRIAADDWIALLEDSFPLARAVLVNAARSVALLCDRLPPEPVVLTPPERPAAPLGSAPLDLIERLLVLLDVPTMRGGGVQALAELAAAADEVAFRPGEVVLPRGVARDRMLVIAEGLVEAARERPQVVLRFGRGQVAGGPVAIGEPSQAWEARALEPTRALSFRLEDWFDAAQEHFDMLRAALAAISDDRVRVLDRIALREDVVLT